MSSDPAYDAVTRARNQESGGNLAGAAQTLEAYLAGDPHNVQVRLELARIYSYALKNRDQGYFQLQIILDLDPDCIDALKASATLKANEKWRRHEADEEYARLVALVEEKGPKSDYAAVCAAYAVFLRKQMGQYVKSAEYYEKAVAAAPDRYEYHQDYAVLLLNELRDYEKAKRELEEVLRIKPNHLSARKNLDRLMRMKFDSEGNLKQGFFSRRRRS
jgi:tetratricopeptide (TPR) repeat protein